MIPCLALGISEELFWTLNPKRLHPHLEAEKLIQEKRDAEMWRMGMYVYDAVRTAVGNVVNGRKSQAKYMDKPLLEQYKEAHQEVVLTEEDEMKQVEAFFLSLETLSTNAKLAKQAKESEKCQKTETT